MQHNNKKSENYNNEILESNTDNYWVNKCIYLLRAKDGCGNLIKFHGKFIFYITDSKTNFNLHDVGFKLDKKIWINNNVIDEKHIKDVERMLYDWNLYKDGWVVRINKNRLIHYLCQIGNNTEPLALDYIKKYQTGLDISQIIYEELVNQTNNIMIN
mgnify:FL=1|tara:strand:- start:631 stop:1101 length:471 start_codon:yes stop_codon:yes gene_type:complete